MNQLKIIQEKTKGKLDSTFYYGTIAELIADDGTFFTVVGTGEIDFDYNGLEYRRRDDGVWNNWIDTITDKIIEDIEFVNNSWFQIEAFKNNEYIETNDDCVYDYDSAIGLLEDTVKAWNSGKFNND